MTRIVVDTSAVVAILAGEPDAERFEAALFTPGLETAMTSANLLEAMLVMEARFPDVGVRDLRAVMADADITVEPVTVDLTEAAFRGWRRFGRGRHAAGLNLGDCFSYALARSWDVPLLFKGNDFAQTDVAAAI